MLGEMDRHQLLGPLKITDPLRGNENLMAEPPVAGGDDHVPNHPGLLVNEQARDASDLAIRGFDAITDDHLATAQVRILIPLRIGGDARARFRLRLRDTVFRIGTT